MAQIKIPDALKADVPQSNWGKVLAATPVIMTVIATLAMASRQRNLLRSLAAVAGLVAVALAIYVMRRSREVGTPRCGVRSA